MTVNDRAMATRQQGGAIATEGPGSNPWASMGLLKPYAPDPVFERPRVDAFATVSAGYRNKDSGYPERSRDGTIYVSGDSGRAEGLKEVLKANGGKFLTIAVVSDDPDEVMQQRFAERSASRLLTYGNQDALVVITVKDTGRKDKQNKPILESSRETVYREEKPERFAQLAARCKVETSFYFVLARWDDDGRPRLYFPDGVGFYRLRFTSLNSAEILRGQLSYIASLNGGGVAGVPLEMRIAYREVSSEDGSRRTVPVWAVALKPPHTIEMTARNVARILGEATEEARGLALAAPVMETLDLAENEGPDVDLDDPRVIDGEAREITQQDARRLAGGGPIRNPKGYAKAFMMMVGKSSLRDKENRQTFMLAATHGRYDSLKTFAENASHEDGNALVKAAAEWINQERSESPSPPVARPAASQEQPARSYEDLFPEDDEQPATPTPAAPAAPVARMEIPPEVHAAATLTGAPAPAPQRPEEAKVYSRAQWEAMYHVWAERLRRMDVMQKPQDVASFKNGALRTEVLRIIAEVDDLEAYFASMPPDDGDDEPVAEESDEEPTLVDAF